jgi:hypothetical protein
MRVGLQALVGVDTIVGGPPVGGAFDQGRPLGEASVLPLRSRELPFSTDPTAQPSPAVPVTVV